MTWWKKQKEFFEKQIIPFAKKIKQEEGSLNIICLGDVFDSRATVSVFIMHEVAKLFTRLASISNKFYIICGNHDTYTEQTAEYNSLQLALGQISNLELVIGSHHNIMDGDKISMLLPWHEQKEKPIDEWTKEPGKDFIFTHADIITGSPKLKKPVFSGHLHSPYINGNVRNLGSCFSLTFADANQDRYFYLWDSETDELKRYTNDCSIKFWRVYNEDIFDFDWTKVQNEDYVEIYIKNSLLQIQEYQSLIARLRKDYKNCWVIPQPDELLLEQEGVECDIESIIEHSIPDNLREKFNYIRSKIS